MEQIEWIKVLILIPFGWSLLEQIKQGRKQAAFQTTLTSLTASVQNITTMVTELNLKFNLFVKTEIDTLKEIVEDNTQALKDIRKL